MKFLIIFFISVSLYSDIKNNIYELYQNKRYKEACSMGMRHFTKYKNDEQYISLYAFSCLEADYLDRLATPLTKLKFSSEARKNSAYFSIILMQKKLLYHALVDGQELKEFNFPTTDYILSKVFDLYSKSSDNKNKSYYLFEDKENKDLSYKLYLLKGSGLSKMIIEEIYNNKIIKQHKYW
ncbi:MAG: hypothetical protein U9N02_07975 [Campylobacterota bacterium]|nr:hypothetical protein [Campylobacterota bacterium]